MRSIILTPPIFSFQINTENIYFFKYHRKITRPLFINIRSNDNNQRSSKYIVHRLTSINNLVLLFSSDRIVTCCCAYNYEILYNEIFVFVLLFFEGGTENCILPLDLFRQMPTTGGKKWFPFPGFQHFFTKRMLPSDRDLDPCFEQRLFYPSLGARGSFEISWKSNGAWKTRERRSIALRSKVRWCNNWYRYRCNSINFSLFNLQQLCLLSISFVSSLKIFAMVYPSKERESYVDSPLFIPR